MDGVLLSKQKAKEINAKKPLLPTIKRQQERLSLCYYYGEIITSGIKLVSKSHFESLKPLYLRCFVDVCDYSHSIVPMGLGVRS